MVENVVKGSGEWDELVVWDGRMGWGCVGVLLFVR